MTKAAIVQTLCEWVGGFSKRESAEIVDSVFELMKETLGHGARLDQRVRQVRSARQARAAGPEPADGRGDHDRGEARAHVQRRAGA